MWLKKRLPSLIFWSSSSRVGSMSSHPSGGRFLLRRTLGIVGLACFDKIMLCQQLVWCLRHDKVTWQPRASFPSTWWSEGEVIKRHASNRLLQDLPDTKASVWEDTTRSRAKDHRYDNSCTCIEADFPTSNLSWLCTKLSAGQYGLRNKREVWRVKYTLAKIRKAARELLTLDEKSTRRLFEGNALLRRLVRIGVLDESRMKLDYVLGLKVEDFLERRLQTQVFKLGLAKSIHHARVLIRQRHIRWLWQ